MGQGGSLRERSTFFVTYLLICFAQFQANELSRFHYGQVVQDHVFGGKIIAARYTKDILTCGHFCLKFPQCGSYSYEISASNHGLCEVNEAGPRTLIFKKGFVFVELLTTWLKSPKSCWEYKEKGAQSSGIYPVQTTDGNWYRVYCDLTSERGWAWTLVMSQSLGNRNLYQFKTSALFNDSSLHEGTPNWEAYRLSLKRMKQLKSESSHWRVTCSFPQLGVDRRDYVRGNFAEFDPLTFLSAQDKPECKKVEYINIRGHNCSHCTSGWFQNPSQFLHIDSYFSSNCEFDKSPGGAISEDNFGYYELTNSDFRCTAGETSTTNHWFGKADVNQSC